MSAPTTNFAFKYPECRKGDFHTGEALALVCLEPKCIENSVICGICYSEEHKNHKIKPLKLVINNSKKYLEHLTPINIDVKEFKESINEQKKNLLNKYDEFEKLVIGTISIVKENINALYIKITETIDLKTGSNAELLKALDEIKEQELEHEKFISLMSKLLAGVPLENEEEEAELNPQEIKETVSSITKRIEKGLVSKTEIIKKEMTTFSDLLQSMVNNPRIFDSRLEFKFSTTFKHSGVEVVNDNLIKSVEAYNYHFGLLEPAINSKGNKEVKVSFNIKENTSNWVAVGLCNKATVELNAYQFNYSTLGHGGYLISSNGGSWSSADTTKNNVVTSFHFAVGDTIVLHYIPDDKKVVFWKKDQMETQTHTLEIEAKDEEELHLCCLFYYNSDEIEYLGFAD